MEQRPANCQLSTANCHAAPVCRCCFNRRPLHQKRIPKPIAMPTPPWTDSRRKQLQKKSKKRMPSTRIELVTLRIQLLNSFFSRTLSQLS